MHVHTALEGIIFPLKHNEEVSISQDIKTVKLLIKDALIYSGGLRTGTPISEHDFNLNQRVHDTIDKKVASEDRSTISKMAMPIN